jgi:hypothetical protein
MFFIPSHNLQILMGIKGYGFILALGMELFYTIVTNPFRLVKSLEFPADVPKTGQALCYDKREKVSRLRADPPSATMIWREKNRRFGHKKGENNAALTARTGGNRKNSGNDGGNPGAGFGSAIPCDFCRTGKLQS